jgi:hypothetical protein
MDIRGRRSRGPAKEESMTRLGSLIFCATLGIGLLACANNGGNGGSGGNAGSSVSGNGGSGSGGSSVSGSGGGPAGGTSGTSTKDPLDLVPVDNTVPGWTVDQAHNKSPGARAMTATTESGVMGLIDGAGEYFYGGPNTPAMFLWQNYVNSTLAAAPDGAAISLYILQMPSAEQASGIYTWLPQQPGTDYSRKSGTPDDWQATSPVLGTASRIQDTTSQWWINFYQDVFYVEVLLDPSTGPAPDYTPHDPDLKQEAIRFAQAVANKM